MNAHIAKPIVPNTLFSALLQWIEPGGLAVRFNNQRYHPAAKAVGL